MHQLKSIYNSPFKDSYSHPIHTCFAMIASNETHYCCECIVNLFELKVGAPTCYNNDWSYDLKHEVIALVTIPFTRSMYTLTVPFVGIVIRVFR